jgi:hypothetical protein
LFYPTGQGVIHACGKEQQEEEKVAGLVIEIKTNYEQIGIPEGHSALHQGKTNQNNRKIGPEKNTDEVQRLGWIKQQMGEEIEHVQRAKCSW